MDTLRRPQGYIRERYTPHWYRALQVRMFESRGHVIDLRLRQTHSRSLLTPGGQDAVSCYAKSVNKFNFQMTTNGLCIFLERSNGRRMTTTHQ